MHYIIPQTKVEIVKTIPRNKLAYKNIISFLLGLYVCLYCIKFVFILTLTNLFPLNTCGASCTSTSLVFAIGFASSRAEARQLVGHGHFEVNGKRVDIASYLLKAGDVVSICEKSRGSEKIKAVVEANSARPVPQWIDINRDQLTAKVIALPTRDQIEAPVDEQLIVEFYSK